MKILTKDWAKKYEIARFIGTLKNTEQVKDLQELKNLCRGEFYKFLSQDSDMKKLIKNDELFIKLFNAKLDRNIKTINCLPKDLFDKLENVEYLFLGFATEKDKKYLTEYQGDLILELENLSKKARKITEKSGEYLSNPFDLDEIVGELIYNEYPNGKNYYIEIGGRVLCVKDYKILERDNFNINSWQEDNPLTCWSCVKAVELHFENLKGFELHLLVLNGDEYENTENLYFTLLGKDVILI